MGRVNLIKMVLLPKFLYVLLHAPIYLPLRIFKTIEAILNSFVWGSSRHKLSWQTLKNPTDLGGAALPDFNLYYLAAQLSHFFHLDKHDKKRCLSLLCVPHGRRVSHPFQTLFKGTNKIDNRKGILYHYCRVWEVVKHKLKMPSTHSHAPLWDNSDLGELLKVPNPELWLHYGVGFLSDVYSDNMLKSFQQLKTDFDLPNTMLFCYLQLRHALSAQFGGIPPDVEQIDVPYIMLGSDHCKLISGFYNSLLRPTAVSIAYKLKDIWSGDVGELEDDEWEDALENCKKVSTKLSDCLTHLYILHRSYLTPHRIAKYKPNQNPNCPRCNNPSCTFFHLLWLCPAIQDYWSQIVTFIHDEMGSPLSLCPKQCLLGVFPDPDSDKYHKIFLQESLFIARLLIARKWMQITPPTLREWISNINNVLPYKKEIYAHRGCPTKYGRVWDTWLENASTCNTPSE